MFVSLVVVRGQPPCDCANNLLNGVIARDQGLLLSPKQRHQCSIREGCFHAPVRVHNLRCDTSGLPDCCPLTALNIATKSDAFQLSYCQLDPTRRVGALD
jgi:hypothetical protein